MCKGSHFFWTLYKMLSNTSMLVFYIKCSYSNKLTSLLLATHCTFPELSLHDLEGFDTGWVLKLTLETLERASVQGLLLVSMRQRSLAALALLKSPSAAGMFHGPGWVACCSVPRNQRCCGCTWSHWLLCFSHWGSSVLRAAFSVLSSCSSALTDIL